VPLVEGDYDFAWSYVDGKPNAEYLNALSLRKQ
jgi:hypothetical protein